MAKLHSHVDLSTSMPCCRCDVPRPRLRWTEDPLPVQRDIIWGAQAEFHVAHLQPIRDESRWLLGIFSTLTLTLNEIGQELV